MFHRGQHKVFKLVIPREDLEATPRLEKPVTTDKACGSAFGPEYSYATRKLPLHLFNEARVPHELLDMIELLGRIRVETR